MTTLVRKVIETIEAATEQIVEIKGVFDGKRLRQEVGEAAAELAVAMAELEVALESARMAVAKKARMEAELWRRRRELEMESK